MESDFLDVAKALYTFCDDSYNHVESLCQPLYQYTPIDVFDYGHFYDNGELFEVTTRPDYSYQLFHQKTHSNLVEFDSCFNAGIRHLMMTCALPLPKQLLRQEEDKHEYSIQLASDHQVYHRLVFIHRKNDYYRVCMFASSQDTHTILHYYLNHLETLVQFVNYFEKKMMTHMTEQKQPYRFAVPGYLGIEPKPKITPSNSLTLEGFLQSAQFENISEREKQCLALIAKGYTAKAVASQLYISSRTVEQHMRNLKQKLGLHTKSQLIDLWHSH